MPLTHCSNCGEKIGKKETVCPHCDVPTENGTGIITRLLKWFGLFTLIITVFYLWIHEETTPLPQATKKIENGQSTDQPTCEIQDFTFKTINNSLNITGTSNCEQGKITLKVYDAVENSLLGVKDTILQNHAFETTLEAKTPSNLGLRYTITP